MILISGTLHTRGPERNSGHVTVLVLLDSLTVLGPEILDGKLETRYVYALEDIYFTLKMIYLTPYEVWVSTHQADERLTARSREASKVRDSCLNFSNPSEIWQAPRQRCCRDACPISEWYNHYNVQSRGFETSWDLTVRRLTASWGPDISCSLLQSKYAVLLGMHEYNHTCYSLTWHIYKVCEIVISRFFQCS